MIWIQFAIVLIVAVLLDIYLVRGRRRYIQLRKEQQETGESKQAGRMELIKRAFALGSPREMRNEARTLWITSASIRQRYITIAELALIAIWALFVSRNYLNMNPRVIPSGNEFGSTIQTDNLWAQVEKCGWCALWNGFEQGGYPALADVQGSMIHPIVIVTTLLWGVINGAKITFVLALWFAGLAQWWIARSLKLGIVPRLWSASIAVAGGYITGRMELGVVGVVLSTAMSSLMLAGVIHLATNRGKRAAILLGVLIASALLAGQGYMQVGLIGIAPALIFLIVKDERSDAPLWKKYLLAGGLGLLLAAPLLVPFLHFSPNFAKDVDTQFREAQPLAYLPLNLVIDDVRYYQSDILGKFPYPYLYILYIGWIPILLAVFGFARGRPQDRKLFWFMGSGIILAFLIGSAEILKWLVNIWPSVADVRHPPQIASLAVPLILAFAAYGLEQLFSLSLHWPNLSLGLSDRNTLWNWKWQIPLGWLLFIPLVFSTISVYRFSQFWITTTTINQDVFNILSALKTNTTEWVEPPFGEHVFIQPAIEMGLKLSPGIMTWSWAGRVVPAAVLYASRQGVPPGKMDAIGKVENITIYKTEGEEYAAIVNDQTQESCEASGSGGQITVQCHSTEAGQLVVKENMWSGWYAWMDGQPTQLDQSSRWLKVESPAGEHTFLFRYLPWDVPLGLALFGAGVCACIWLWVKHSDGEPREEK